jgi:hypothetical protein
MKTKIIRINFRTENKRQYDLIVAVLKAAGCSSHDSVPNYGCWPHLKVNLRERKIYGTGDGYIPDKNGTEIFIGLADFVKRIDEFLPEKPTAVTIQLNSNCTAVVEKDSIEISYEDSTVAISKTQLEELHKAVSQVLKS